ncbi:MAG: hypothetical protein AUG44_08745 [Actinobacteria bacterium 13_1_20CM_3_71_11]|nr:MAG: hypothetical protein AUG44_08745 [Actinobacteria bacterium 13_1_20CM_3_71_11]
MKRRIRKFKEAVAMRGKLEEAHEERRKARDERSRVLALHVKLQKHLEENRFADRLIRQLYESRR